MNRYGYLLCSDGDLRPARDLRELAQLLARARRDGCQRVEAFVRVTMTRYKPLSAGESAALVRETTDLLTRSAT